MAKIAPVARGRTAEQIEADRRGRETEISSHWLLLQGQMRERNRLSELLSGVDAKIEKTKAHLRGLGWKEETRR